MELTLEMLDPRAQYCVVSDISMRASEVVSGRRLRAEFGDEKQFRRFQPEEPLCWSNHVRLRCGRFDLAVWRDPTRPELNTSEEVFKIAEIIRPEAAEAFSIVSLATEADSINAENELAREIAEDSERDWYRNIVDGACRFMKSLYVH